MNIILDEDLQKRLAATAASVGQEPNHYAVAVLTKAIESHERAQAEKEAALHGPAHRFDPDAIRRKYIEKYGIPDLSHLSSEELDEQGEAILSQLDRATVAVIERGGVG